MAYLLVRMVSKKRYSVYEISPERDKNKNTPKNTLHMCGSNHTRVIILKHHLIKNAFIFKLPLLDTAETFYDSVEVVLTLKDAISFGYYHK